MGFRDWFGAGARADTRPDSIWLSAAARLAGLRRHAEGRAGDGQVILLAHFPRSLDRLAAALDGIDFERADSEGDVASWLGSPASGRVGLALVSQLPRQGLDLIGQTAGLVTFLVAERHPHRAQDDRVERLAAGLPYPTRVEFHLALDDPLLERFVGERVTGMLTRLGMGEDEALSHPAISSAVAGAQERLARESGPEAEAASVEDWLDAIEPIEPR